MGRKGKEIILLVLALAALGLALYTFRPKPAAPVETAALPESGERAARPGQARVGEEPTSPEGAEGLATEPGAAARNPFASPEGGAAGPTMATGGVSPEAGEAAPGGEEPATGAPEAPQVTPSPEGTPGGALRLTGIIAGRQPLALIRQDGQRYFAKVGDRIADGYRVQTIGSQEVVLVGKEGKIILRMGGRQ